MSRLSHLAHLLVAPSLRRTRALYLVAFCSLLGCAVATYLLFKEWALRFPTLTDGAYVGSLEDPASRDARHVPLFVEVQGDDLLVVALDPAWKPQRVSMGQAGGSSAVPLVLSSGETKFTFTGSSTGEGTYGGHYVAAERKGRWELTRITSVEQISDTLTASLKLWLLLFGELSDVERKIVEAQRYAPEQRAEIDRLSLFVSEAESLKSKANEKYLAMQRELERTQAVLKERRKEAQKLQNMLSISQKLSGSGKLAALSRETLERERRWISSVMRASRGQDGIELADAVEKSEAIVKLRREIASEQRKLDELRAETSQTSGGSYARD